MNCEKIKELILTDYIDNEISGEKKVRLNIHLAHCLECREFFEMVKNTIVEPFASAKKIDPPGFIWYRVKEAIIAKQQERLGFVASIFKKLRSVFYIPKPALAMSTIMALLFIVALMVNLKFSNKQALETNREDQAEYSTFSIETPVNAVLNNDGGFGTLVEKYFL
jgi:anti-sigma factor RsiW